MILDNSQEPEDTTANQSNGQQARGFDMDIQPTNLLPENEDTQAKHSATRKTDDPDELKDLSTPRRSEAGVETTDVNVKAWQRRSESTPAVEARQISEREAEDFLGYLHNRERQRYIEMNQVMSFGDYMKMVFSDPQHMIRNSSQYTVDALESYGAEPKLVFGQEILDFNAKNWPWQPAELEEKVRLSGQELPLWKFYERECQNARQEHPNRMIIMHGPPGSGKTLLSETISQTLEHYSRNNPEGAIYRLAFGFNSEKQANGIGFSAGVNATEVDSDPDENPEGPRFRYVIRPHGNTDPIFMLPGEPAPGEDKSARQVLVDMLEESGKIDGDFNRSYLLSGELDSTSERVLTALLEYYNGDFKQVVENHVFVERWTMSSQTGRGLASIRPNHDWSSDIEPMASRYSFQGQAIPPQIASAEGELYVARALALGTNRGHLHFADLLRPNERDRGDTDISRLAYLLEMVEGGTTQIISRREPSLVRTEKINTLFRADSNDEHIEAKRRGSGWKSFVQRCDFVTVGYIRRYLEEARANEDKFERMLGPERNAAPHVLETVSAFVTATRLLKPEPRNYDLIHEDLPKALRGMTPMQKALLLQENGEVDPNLLREDSNRLTARQLRVLKRHLPEIANEYMHGVGSTRFSLYDGGIGISTRETEDLLKEIVGSSVEETVTVLDVLNVLQEKLEGGFPYYQDIGLAKEQYQRELLEARKQQSLAEGRPLSGNALEKAEEEIRKEIERQFPMAAPQVNFRDAEKFARSRVQRDVYHALGLADQDSVAHSLRRYIEHIKVHRAQKGQVAPQYRVPPGSSNSQPSKELMEDFEDRVVSTRNFSSETQRQQYRNKTLETLGRWATEYRGEDPMLNLESIFTDEYADIKKLQKQQLNESLKSFVARTWRYEGHPETVVKHETGDSRQRREVAEWQRAVEQLEELGYPRDSIAKHVIWAFEMEEEE